MIHCCTHIMLEIYLMIRVIYDVMPNNKIEGTVFDLDINDQWVSDYWHGVGIDKNTEGGML